MSHKGEFFIQSKIFKDTLLIRWSDIREMKNFLDRNFYFCSFLLRSTARGCMNEFVKMASSIALLKNGPSVALLTILLVKFLLQLVGVVENLKNWSMDPLKFDDFWWISRIDCTNFLTAKVPWVKWLECVNWRMIHTTNT